MSWVPSQRWVLASLFTLVFAVILLTANRGPIGGDANQMCAAARGIVDHGWPDVDARTPGDIVEGRDHRRYVKYPLLSVLQCVPATQLDAGAQMAFPHNAGIRSLAIGIVPAALAALAALLFALLCIELGASLSVAIWLGLAIIFTTPLWAAGRTMYGEINQTALIVGWALVWCKARKSERAVTLVLGGFLAGLGIHAKAPFAVLVPACCVYILSWKTEPMRIVRHLAWTALGAIVPLASWLAYNYVRFGDALQAGYSQGSDADIAFGTPLATGLYGLLASSGKSIFLYAPLLFLLPFTLRSFARMRGKELLLITLPIVATFLVMAKWWAWSGDWAWGPRLVMPVVPLMFLPLIWQTTRRAMKYLAVALTVVGAFINFTGVAVEQANYTGLVISVTRNSLEGGAQPLRDDLAAAHFIPEFSPLIGQPWLLRLYFARDFHVGNSWYPWKSLGVRDWQLRTDPTPHELNFWYWGNDDTLTKCVIGLLVLLSALSGIVIGKARATPSPST